MLRIDAVARATAKGLALSLLLLSAPASAVPVTLYANGDAKHGFDPDDVAAAIAAGADEPRLVSGLFGGDGFLTVTTPDQIPGRLGKNEKRPSQGTSTWTLEISEFTPPTLLEDVLLVILGHDPRDPLQYATKHVGLQIDTELPWLLVQNAAAPAQIYVALRLGNLEEQAGSRYPIPEPIEYRVSQRLRQQEGEFVFPRYSIAFVSLPEPSVLALLLAAGVVGAAARRAG